MTHHASARPSALTTALLFGAGLCSVAAAFLAPSPASAAGCESGTLIKGSLSAVYYCGADGKRYVFANDKTFFTWYSDFSATRTMTDAQLGEIAIGGNVTYRPGRRMVKIQSDPRTYAIAHGGVLRHVPSEACAQQLYGASWNREIDDVSDAFFVNYRVGEPLSSCADFDRSAEMALGASVNADKGLTGSAAPWITMTTPSLDAAGVALGSEVRATFGGAMRASTITPATFTLTKSGSSSSDAVAGTVTFSDRTATFRPTSQLDPYTTYRATLTTGALDGSGRALASDYRWTFTTGAASGTPSNPGTPGSTSVTAISPPDGGSSVASGTPISVTFSGPMTASTLNADSVRLMRGETSVPGTVAVSGNTVTFTPSSALQANTAHTVRLDSSVRDAAGSPISGGAVSWSFTTGQAS